MTQKRLMLHRMLRKNKDHMMNWMMWNFHPNKKIQRENRTKIKINSKVKVKVNLMTKITNKKSTMMTKMVNNKISKAMRRMRISLRSKMVMKNQKNQKTLDHSQAKDLNQLSKPFLRSNFRLKIEIKPRKKEN